MLFPQDDDVAKYDVRREQMGFPKATVVMTDENGQPRLRADKTIDTRYGRGMPDPDCRHCAIWAAAAEKGKPGANVQALGVGRIDRSSWSEAERNGAHNPRNCKRAIHNLLKAGAAGADFLEERNYGRK